MKRIFKVRRVSSKVKENQQEQDKANASNDDISTEFAVVSQTVAAAAARQQALAAAKQAATAATVSPPKPKIEFRPIYGFENADEADSPLKWFCPPDGWGSSIREGSREGKNGWWEVSQGELLVAAPAKKDFWRKTYYEPLFVKDDAPFLYSTVPMDSLPVTIETSFTLTPKCQFDQAGIFIRIDSEHWIKCGIENVDGIPRLSCVVTNGFSDWSTQKWEESSLRIRVHMLPQHGGSYVVEACPLSDDEKNKPWTFMRIAHMNKNMNHDFLNDHPNVQNSFKGPNAPTDCLMAGVFAACPEDQSGSNVLFHDLSIKKGSTFVHSIH